MLDIVRTLEQIGLLKEAAGLKLAVEQPDLFDKGEKMRVADDGESGEKNSKVHQQDRKTIVDKLTACLNSIENSIQFTEAILKNSVEVHDISDTKISSLKELVTNVAALAIRQGIVYIAAAERSFYEGYPITGGGIAKKLIVERRTNPNKIKDKIIQLDDMSDAELLSMQIELTSVERYARERLGRGSAIHAIYNQVNVSPEELGEKISTILMQTLSPEQIWVLINDDKVIKIARELGQRISFYNAAKSTDNIIYKYIYEVFQDLASTTVSYKLNYKAKDIKDYIEKKYHLKEQAIEHIHKVVQSSPYVKFLDKNIEYLTGLEPKTISKSKVETILDIIIDQHVSRGTYLYDSTDKIFNFLKSNGIWLDILSLEESKAETIPHEQELVKIVLEDYENWKNTHAKEFIADALSSGFAITPNNITLKINVSQNETNYTNLANKLSNIDAILTTANSDKQRDAIFNSFEEEWKNLKKTLLDQKMDAIWSLYSYKRINYARTRGQDGKISNVIVNFPKWRGKTNVEFEFDSSDKPTKKSIEQLSKLLKAEPLKQLLTSTEQLDRAMFETVAKIEGISVRVRDCKLPIDEIVQYAEFKTKSAIRDSCANLENGTGYLDYATSIVSAICDFESGRQELGVKHFNKNFIEGDEILRGQDSRDLRADAAKRKIFVREIMFSDKYRVNENSTQEERIQKARSLVDDYIAWCTSPVSSIHEYESVPEIARIFVDFGINMHNQKSALAIADVLWRELHNNISNSSAKTEAIKTIVAHSDCDKVVSSATIKQYFITYIKLYPFYYFNAKDGQASFQQTIKSMFSGKNATQAVEPALRIWENITQNKAIGSSPDSLAQLQQDVRIVQFALFGVINESKISDIQGLAEPKVPEIEMAAWDLAEYNFRFSVIEDEDPRHFTVGHETDCCQILGGAGEAAAIDSYINKYAGVLLLEINIDNQWELAYQSYFHWVPNYGYILDNIEENKNVSKLVKKFTGYSAEELYAMWAKQIKKKMPSVKNILLGKSFTAIDTDAFSSIRLKEDPRIFHTYVENDPYSDFDPSNASDLLKYNSSNTGTINNDDDDDDDELSFEDVVGIHRVNALSSRDSELLANIGLQFTYRGFGLGMKKYLIALSNALGINTDGWKNKPLNWIESRVFPGLRGRKAHLKHSMHIRKMRFERRTLFKLQFLS